MQKSNKTLLWSWGIMVGILVISYIGEVLKGERSIPYLIFYACINIFPLIGCICLYHHNKNSKLLRYLIAGSFFVMYIFVLFTGNTPLTYIFILPLLAAISLFHDPMFSGIFGGGALFANICHVAWRIATHQVALEDSRDIEIQLASVLLCFGFLYVVSRVSQAVDMHDKEVTKKVEEQAQELQKVTFSTIVTIANLIDAKDTYTRGHSQRVADYASELAEGLGYSEEAVQRIRYIGLFHDVGKIGVPDAVLNKPGRLTDEEYQLMKEHVIIGGHILQGSDLIADLEQGAMYHHERYDGKGYVHGLSGEAIPEIARIICIADAYDAMTSNRVYRHHLSQEAVLAELRKGRGTQFDPVMLDKFLELLAEGKIVSKDGASNNDSEKDVG